MTETDPSTLAVIDAELGPTTAHKAAASAVPLHWARLLPNVAADITGGRAADAEIAPPQTAGRVEMLGRRRARLVALLADLDAVIAADAAALEQRIASRYTAAQIDEARQRAGARALRA